MLFPQGWLDLEVPKQVGASYLPLAGVNDFGAISGSGGAEPLTSCWQEGLPRAWSTVSQEP